LAAVIFVLLFLAILGYLAIPPFLLMLGSVYWCKHHPGTWLAIIGDLLALLLICFAFAIFVHFC
jgi:hypothetical protein